MSAGKVDLPFEAALEELEKVVERLERGEIALEEMVVAYERGRLLQARCGELLEGARLRIEKLTPDGGGGMRAEPAPGLNLGDDGDF